MADTTTPRWGPFSGRQLTTIACALAGAAAIAPSAAFAVDAFSNVAIQDPVSGAKAAVDPQRRLQVAGTVVAREAAPSDLVRGFVTASTTCQRVLTPASGRAAVVTQVHVNTFRNPTPGEGDLVSFFVGSSCDRFVFQVNPPGLGSHQLDLGLGVPVPAGQSLWARRLGENSSEVYVFGYQVSGGQVPATAAAAASDQAPPQQP